MKSKVIAITGGIGSGKSEVARYLQSLGYSALDCDGLAREIAMRPEVIERVRKLLGDEFVVGGQLNRKAIRDRIFSDRLLLKQYNEIFFDEVKKLLCNRIAHIDNGLKSSDSSLARIFVEIPVFDAFFFPWDEVWLVEADINVRFQRVTARDSTSGITLENILRNQKVCGDYTLKIINDGNLDDLKRQVDTALKRFETVDF